MPWVVVVWYHFTNGCSMADGSAMCQSLVYFGDGKKQMALPHTDKPVVLLVVQT